VTQASVAAGLQLRVARPAFSSVVNATEWRLKLVAHDYSCETLPVTGLTCADSGCIPDNVELGPDEAIFELSGALAADTYLVCFMEDGSWVPIPAEESRYLVVGTPGASHPRGPFHYQRFSARAGENAAVAVAGYQMRLPNAAKVAIVEGTDGCYTSNATDMGIVAILDGSAASTEEEYVFAGDIPADAKGAYSLCMCADAAYSVASGILDSTHGTTSGFTLSAATAADYCVDKCSGGCVGPDCFCSGLLGSDEADYGLGGDGPLCLDAAACRKACDDEAACKGYSIHTTLPRCWLTSEAAPQTVVDDEAYETWTATGGTCADADFVHLGSADTADAATQKAAVKRNLGTIYVSQKAMVGVNFVVEPGKVSSIEITGQDLNVERDRVMVIDCYGTCGISPPAAAAKVAKSFVEWPPINAIVDPPSLAPRDPPELPDNSAEDYAYLKIPGKYCPGNLLPLLPGSLAAEHQCYTKCLSGETCTDDSCFCGGFIPGFDTESSSALCLDTQQCQWLCSHTPGCHSIDMSSDPAKPRCFLNMETCGEESWNFHTSTDYDLYVKQVDQNTRRLQAQGRALTSAQVRRLLTTEDPGISWDTLLRYKDVTFTSGGEFKLCFCDSDLLQELEGPNAVCDGPEDFTIEVGRVHSTGLQCLLSNPKMVRGECAEQMYGGLRCYDDEVPEHVIPSEYLGVPNPAGADRSALATSLITFCQFAPIQEVMKPEFAFCQNYRIFEPSSPDGAADSP
jgi:hypothetical protein